MGYPPEQYNKLGMWALIGTLIAIAVILTVVVGGSWFIRRLLSLW